MADAARAKPHHDFHLVNPSPWPAVGAVSAFIIAFGLILWMHHVVAYAPIIFGIGAIGVIYTMIGWWRDVIFEAEVEHDHTRVVQISHRYGMILFIASEVMFFVAWFWAYFNTALFPAELKDFARTAFLGGVWPPKDIHTFDPWHLPLLNTLILLTSGTTVTWAHHSLLNNDRKGLIWGLVCTIALGISFTCVQAWEYGHAAFHYSGNIYGATFYNSHRRSISASNLPPGIGTSLTWSGCSCSLASTSGAPARRCRNNVFFPLPACGEHLRGERLRRSVENSGDAPYPDR
jgi:cytochrome c oxidase subunit 3